MKTADKEKLWDAYRQKKTQETREQLIIEYAQREDSACILDTMWNMMIWSVMGFSD